MKLVELATVLFASICVLTVVLWRCGSEPSGPGKVLVKWKLGGTTCEVAGVTTVEIELIQDSNVMYSSEADCSAGEVLIDQVDTGVYDVKLSGKDKNGVVTYQAEFAGLKVKEGSEPSSPPQPLELSLKAGELMLRWTFPADSSTLCSFNNVANVEINVLQSGTNLSLFSATLPCEPMTLNKEELQQNKVTLEEGWVVISDLPSGVDVDVVLFGLSPEDQRVMVGQETVTIPKGGAAKVTVVLEKCNGQCI